MLLSTGLLACEALFTGPTSFIKETAPVGLRRAQEAQGEGGGSEEAFFPVLKENKTGDKSSRSMHTFPASLKTRRFSGALALV